MKRGITLAIVVTVTLAAACSGTEPGVHSPTTALQPGSTSGLEAASDASPETSTTAAPAVTSVEFDDDDLDSDPSTADMAYVVLDGSTVSLRGSGTIISGDVVTITNGGVYSVSGSLAEGQIIVDAQDSDVVRLILNNADISCSTSAPIYVANADKVVITVPDGTQNSVTDGDSYVFPDRESDEPNAAIFSKDDLTINGGGSLTVNGNYNNGIASEDDLVICGGDITVNAVNDGLKGRDPVALRDARATVSAGGDGIQANNDEDPEEGYVCIESGAFDITAEGDGIQAETALTISGGEFHSSSGGGSVNGPDRDPFLDRGMQDSPRPSSDGDSAKGLKAGVDLRILGGLIDIDSADDALHSNKNLTIQGGQITLATGDDGIHSDSRLEISGGEIEITECYEGLESAGITINGGSIRIVASDDGINTVSREAGVAEGRAPGGGGLGFADDSYLHINGGYVVSNAGGDGLDVNGSAEMTDGVVIVHGPTSNNNGPLDYLGDFAVSGGFLVAAGSAGMAQAPSTSSTQYSVMLSAGSPLPAGTMVHIESEEGEDILTFVPSKAYQSLVVSSPELENGASYVVYTGGSSSGTLADGLYTGGTYTPGTQGGSFTVSGIVTGSGGGRARPGGQRP
jgi:hypothetical protein